MPDTSDPDHSLSALKPDCPIEWTAEYCSAHVKHRSSAAIQSHAFPESQDAVMIVVEVIITFGMLEMDSGFVWVPKLRPDPHQGHVYVVLRNTTRWRLQLCW